jgi:hypothetical protein
MSVDLLASFVKDVMDLCISVHISPKCFHACSLTGTKYCRQISLMGFKTAAKYVAAEGASEEAFEAFHEAFNFIST